MIDPAVMAGAIGFIIGAMLTAFAFVRTVPQAPQRRLDRPRDARGRFVARPRGDRMSVGAE